MLFFFAIGAAIVALVGSHISAKPAPKAPEAVFCTLEAQAVYDKNGEMVGLDRDSVRPNCATPTPSPAKEEKPSRTRRN